MLPRLLRSWTLEIELYQVYVRAQGTRREGDRVTGVNRDPVRF